MDIAALTPDTAIHVVGCPEPTIWVELRRAARQFCQDTGIWKVPFQVFAVPGLGRYPIEPEGSATVSSLEWIGLDGKRLEGRDSEVMMRNQDPNAERGRPTHYYWGRADDMVLAPVPDSQYRLEGVMTLIPRRSAMDIPASAGPMPTSPAPRWPATSSMWPRPSARPKGWISLPPASCATGATDAEYRDLSS